MNTDELNKTLFNKIRNYVIYFSKTMPNAKKRRFYKFNKPNNIITNNIVHLFINLYEDFYTELITEIFKVVHQHKKYNDSINITAFIPSDEKSEF